MEISEWASIIFGALGVIGGCFSWYQANASKTARKAAEKAQESAERDLEARELTAERLGPPLLLASWHDEGRVQVLNATAEPFTAITVANRDSFEFVGLEDGTTIPPFQEVDFEVVPKDEGEIPLAVCLVSENASRYFVLRTPGGLPLEQYQPEGL